MRAGPESKSAQGEILVKLAAREIQLPDLTETLARCRKVIHQIEDKEMRLRTELQLLASEHSALISMVEYRGVSKDKVVQVANEAMACVEKAFGIAQQIESMQVAITCSSGQVVENHFDSALQTLPFRRRSIHTVGMLARYKEDFPADFERVRAQVAQWWEESKMLERPEASGGPTSRERQQYTELNGERAVPTVP